MLKLMNKVFAGLGFLVLFADWCLFTPKTPITHNDLFVMLAVIYVAIQGYNSEEK